MDDDRAEAARRAFNLARAALAVVRQAQTPGARADYEQAIARALNEAVKAGVTHPEELAKVAYSVILHGPGKWLTADTEGKSE